MEAKVDTSQLKRLRKEIRRLKPTSPEYARKLGTVNQAAAQLIVSEVQSRANDRQRSRAAGQIKPSAQQSGIALRIASGGSVPYALAAFFGMDRHVGWYAKRRFANSSGRQFDRWVGNSWEPGGAGGPYVLNDAVRARLDDVVKQWAEGIDALAAELNV